MKKTKGYGWLDPRVYRNDHSPLGGYGAPLGEFDYGWPGGTGGGVESNVTFQLLFDEASSPLVDEVASVNLPQVGAPTYQVDTSAYSSKMALGCSIPFNAGWRKGSASTETEPGTDDWVFECVYKPNSPNGELIDTRDPSGVSVGGWYITVSGGTTALVATVVATDGTTVQKSYSVAGLYDGDFHKIRIVFDRSGDLDFYLDGSSQGTQTLAAVSGKFIPAYDLTVCQRATGLFTAIGTFVEQRLSIGTITNNSGGPNGG